MDVPTKRAVFEYVERVDPQHDVVHLQPTADWSGGRISVSDEMTKHREETVLKGEKYVEAYLLVKLIREGGYRPAAIELQREYPVGHPKTDRPRIDIKVNQSLPKGASRTYFFIEAKDPEDYEAERDYSIEHQLYLLADHERVNGLKYLVYYTVRFDGVRLVETADIIDFELFPDHGSWSAAGRPVLDILPSTYALAAKAVYVNKGQQDLADGERTLDRNVGPEHFAALRRNLHNVLWGGGGMFYNDVFSNLVKLFLTKIYDEETTPEGSAYRFQIQSVGSAPETPERTYHRVNELFLEAQHQYLGYTDAQLARARGIDTEKISENKITYVVERLQDISLVENSNPQNGDVLGGFFEGIVEEGFKQSRGQFFTHLNIVHFLIYALGIPEAGFALLTGAENPAKPRLPFIVDPACGSGTFLIEAMKAIASAVSAGDASKRSARGRQFVESMFPPSKPNRWADTYVYGIEINPDLSLATKVNMVLHGDGNINIFSCDGLAHFDRYSLPDKVSALVNSRRTRNFPYDQEVNEQFDFVVSNPPFSIKPDEQTKEGYRRRFEFGTKATSENLFLERWYQLLRPGGGLGVVLPESVFDTPNNRTTRLFLYRYFHINGVVSLPYLAFRPYTSTKTCLLLATKKTRQQVKEYDALWLRGQGIFRKASRRIAAWVAAESDRHRDRVRRQIRRDDQAVLDCLAELTPAKDGTIEAVLAGLRAGAREVQGTVDETQWVFKYVSTHVDYRIFMSEASEVGYKRRKQGADLVRPNDLFERQADGSISVDLSKPKSILEMYLAARIRQRSLKAFFTNFSRIGQQPFLRCDPKYRWFWDHREGRLVRKSKYELVPLRNLVVPAPKVVVKKGNLADERKLIELEDVEGGTGHVLNVRLVDEIGSDKVSFGDAQVVFSKLEPYLGKAILNSPEEDYIGSTEWVPLLVNGRSAKKEFIWALLLSPGARHVFRLLQSGKRHARINMLDFLNILVPNVPIGFQRKLVADLRPEWKRMTAIRDEISRRQDSIEAKLETTLRGGKRRG